MLHLIMYSSAAQDGFQSLFSEAWKNVLVPLTAGFLLSCQKQPKFTCYTVGLASDQMQKFSKTQ